jgi:hypothetical protein
LQPKKLTIKNPKASAVFIDISVFVEGFDSGADMQVRFRVRTMPGLRRARKASGPKVEHRSNASWEARKIAILPEFVRV